MNKTEEHTPQFEPVSIRIRIQTMKVIGTTRKNLPKEIQLRQEDRWFLMMNTRQMHLPQFASASIPARMSPMTATRMTRKNIIEEIQLTQECK
jgi:hypothetical protein